MEKVIITGNTLTLEEIVQVCRNYCSVELSQSAVDRILASRKIVDDFVENKRYNIAPY
ncbi:MAG: histidine ammonia-lyase [Sedimentibacter sp.]|nr:histidine ammonia-lyase [Sedimentibacter sp.]